MSYRIVLDTNEILAAGSAWVANLPVEPVAMAKRLVYRVAKDHKGLICGKIAGEYIEKLIDQKHPMDRVDKYMGLILGSFERVAVASKVCDPAPADPDDAIFILCALDGKAHFLVTEDKHLLDLSAHYNPPEIRNREDIAGRLGL